MKLNQYELTTLKKILEKEIEDTDYAIEWLKSNLDFDEAESKKAHRKALVNIMTEVEFDYYKLLRKDEQ